MHIVFVHTHPWSGSFTKKMLDAAVNGATSGGNTVDVIDLYKDKFSPAMSEKELAGYSKGKVIDTKVLNYQKRISKAQHIVFVFPIWCTDVPAMLKGFFEKVFTPGWAFAPKGMRGLLTHIKGATALYSCGAPAFFCSLVFKDPAKRTIFNLLSFIGVKKKKFLLFGAVSEASAQKQKKVLSKVRAYCTKL